MTGAQLSERPAGPAQAPRASATFHWGMIALSAWLVIGAHIDAWAHINIRTLDTFFTPWHAVLYSGYGALALFLVVSAMRNRAAGFPLERTLPEGYLLSLVGVAIFGVAGVGDLLWHTAFGIEGNLEALISPTHLLLALGGILIVAGPLRAARRQEDAGGAAWMPMLLSLTFCVALLAYMTQYAHPFGLVWPIASARPTDPQDVFPAQAVGLLGIMLQSAILMGPLLLVTRRRPLPFGSLTFILGISTTLLVSMRASLLVTGPLLLVAVALTAGLLCDMLSRQWQPSATRLVAFRAIAFAVPAVLYTLYFLAIVVTGGTWWSVHLVTGAVVLAGSVGMLLSYLVVAPEGVA